MLSFEANKTNSAGPLAPKIQVDGCCWQLIYVATRAATNGFVQIFVRVLAFGFDSFAIGIHLHGIYVMCSKNYLGNLLPVTE